MRLDQFGWDERFSGLFEKLDRDDLEPARVLLETSRVYTLVREAGEAQAGISGRFRHHTVDRKDFPVVGDWVAVEPGGSEGRDVIHDVLPRKSAFLRKEAGKRTQAQVIAANVDTVFLVSGLDGDFNPSRVERYLLMAWESGAKPVIVLNKADLCEDVDGAVETAEEVAPGVPVLPVSAVAKMGMERLGEYIRATETVAFLGSSGVGKSSLVNQLLGTDKQRVRDVREADSRGRHTTTHSQLFVIPGGGIVMDTPGLRELQVWSDGEGLAHAFDDIEEIAANCRFRDCGHDREPGCAIRQALDDGTLSARRWQSYAKLKSELSHLAGRQDGQAKLAEKKRKKELSLHIKQTKNRPRT